MRERKRKRERIGDLSAMIRVALQRDAVDEIASSGDDGGVGASAPS